MAHRLTLQDLRLSEKALKNQIIIFASSYGSGTDKKIGMDTSGNYVVKNKNRTVYKGSSRDQALVKYNTLD